MPVIQIDMTFLNSLANLVCRTWTRPLCIAKEVACLRIVAFDDDVSISIT
jgi:hypothetical protein